MNFEELTFRIGCLCSLFYARRAWKPPDAGKGNSAGQGRRGPLSGGYGPAYRGKPFPRPAKPIRPHTPRSCCTAPGPPG